MTFHLLTCKLAQLQEVETANTDGMRLVTQDDFLKFLAESKSVTIEDVKVDIGKPWHITLFAPPKDYTVEEFTIWSFPRHVLNHSRIT